MKKIYLSGIGPVSFETMNALKSIPVVRELGYDSKAETKKKKKRMRELARRQKRLNILGKNNETKK